jgi:cystathionine beta-lyase
MTARGANGASIQSSSQNKNQYSQKEIYMTHAHKNLKTESLLTHLSSAPEHYQGMVNIPPHRGSTIAFQSMAAFEKANENAYTYGRSGTPSSAAFEDAMIALDGAYGAISGSSGLSVVTAVMSAFVGAGDHLLITDSVYGPTRHYAENILRPFGVDVEFYPPMLGAEIESLFKPNTKAILMESPASLTYEVQDIGAITDAAKAKNIFTIMDNSWATPLLLRPLDLGIDVSIMSGTKYIGGHSDILLGVATANEKAYPLIKKAAMHLGVCAGSEELYLGLRGLRTLAVRMKQHEQSALTIAHFLESHPAVLRVQHPALPSARGHANFKKYFKGSSGTFSILLKEKDKAKIIPAFDKLNLFHIGFSWGGYESLLFPSQPQKYRTAEPWANEGFNLRLHIGLEHVDDLQNELNDLLNKLV